MRLFLRPRPSCFVARIFLLFYHFPQILSIFILSRPFDQILKKCAVVGVVGAEGTHHPFFLLKLHYFSDASDFEQRRRRRMGEKIIFKTFSFFFPQFFLLLLNGGDWIRGVRPPPSISRFNSNYYQTSAHRERKRVKSKEREGEDGRNKCITDSRLLWNEIIKKKKKREKKSWFDGGSVPCAAPIQ